MTTAEAAKYLSMGESTLRRWRSEGIGPDYYDLSPGNRERGLIRYHTDDLERWAKRNLRTEGTIIVEVDGDAVTSSAEYYFGQAVVTVDTDGGATNKEQWAITITLKDMDPNVNMVAFNHDSVELIDSACSEGNTEDRVVTIRGRGKLEMMGVLQALAAAANQALS